MADPDPPRRPLDVSLPSSAKPSREMLFFTSDREDLDQDGCNNGRGEKPRITENQSRPDHQYRISQVDRVPGQRERSCRYEGSRRSVWQDIGAQPSHLDHGVDVQSKAKQHGDRAERMGNESRRKETPERINPAEHECRNDGEGENQRWPWQDVRPFPPIHFLCHG